MNAMSQVCAEGLACSIKPAQCTAVRLPFVPAMLWDPFDHSEGSFRPNVKKSEKSLEMGSQGLLALGGKKVRKELKTS